MEYFVAKDELFSTHVSTDSSGTCATLSISLKKARVSVEERSLAKERRSHSNYLFCQAFLQTSCVLLFFNIISPLISGQMTDSGADLAAAIDDQNKATTDTAVNTQQIGTKDAPEQDQNLLKQDQNLLKHVAYDYSLEHHDNTVEVNMEATITVDDVAIAGGFGARDDIGSFLPVATDSTDFEASLRDARGFEEPQEEALRSGLGWTDNKD